MQFQSFLIFFRKFPQQFRLPHRLGTELPLSGTPPASDDWRAKENLQTARLVRHSVRDLSEHGITMPGEFDRTECVPDKPRRLIQILYERDRNPTQEAYRTEAAQYPTRAAWKTIIHFPIVSVPAIRYTYGI